MLTRRSFAALAGAGLFGLFARVRFKPSAPRWRVRRVAIVTRMNGRHYNPQVIRDAAEKYRGVKVEMPHPRPNLA